LSTFILCFDGTGWYRRSVFLVMLAAGLGLMGWALADSRLTYKLSVQVGLFCLGLFLGCMFCQGELARSKPAPAYLTRSYLMVALGGAAGSALIGIVAPLVLPAYFELGGALVLTAVLLFWHVRRDHAGFRILAAAAVVVTIGCGGWSTHEFYFDTVAATRNFYGVLRVRDAVTYDINPNVLDIAQRDFSYLKDSQATIELVLGDARLSLERKPKQDFDVLVVDAYFGDAIPVHLLPTQALEIYRGHVKPGGVIAIHVTNQFLNLIPIVAELADAHHLFVLHIRDHRETGLSRANDWMLLSDRPASLGWPKLSEAARAVEKRPDWRLWTDDFRLC
jgi:SAM-dependent methyltransferase